MLDGSFLWAALMLREANIQSALRLFLADKLKTTAIETSSTQDAQFMLPFQDPFVRMATQLCQLSNTTAGQIPEIDQTILRVGLPLIIFVLSTETDATAEHKITIWNELCPNTLPSGLLDAIFETCMKI